MRSASATGCVLAVALVALLAVQMSVASRIKVDGQKVVDQLTKLAAYSDHPNPNVTRILFTPNDMIARSYVKELMTAAGLAIREDAVGNIFGRWEGSDAAAGSVLTGSHCDAIPYAGMYDGTVGVIGAIEALATLKRAGFQPRRPLEVMMFTSEEPTRFGLSCIGSRAMAGVLSASYLDSKLDVNGTGFLEAANAVGYGGASTQEVLDATLLKGKGKVDYFVELHIEQGPLLEAESLDIGVVTAIAAPSALQIEFSGEGGHAGALLMPYRNDAGLAAAELALRVEQYTLETKSIDTVGTTGVFEILPGAVNSVPREAKLGIDVRDIDGARRDEVVAKILAAAEEIAAKRKVRVKTMVQNQDPPATCHDDIIAAAAASAKEMGLSTKHMVSRAYHDSLFMASIAPTGMIFIPCKGGYSHRPDEFSSPQEIANGVSVLALTMAQLSGGEWAQPKTEL